MAAYPHSLGACASAIAALMSLHAPSHPTSITVQLEPPAALAHPAGFSQRHILAEAKMRVVMFGECRGQGAECMILIGHTILNRDHANLPGRYGSGILGVIGKPFAYSCMLSSDKNQVTIRKAIAGQLPPHSPDARAWALAGNVAHRMMHTWEPDPTHGAAFYYAKTIKAPAWVHDRGMVRVAALFGHVFYRKEARA